MADAKETMRYLTKEYEIAPAGTREEIDAAAALARVFHQHGLQSMQKSFNYTWHGNLGLAVLVILVAVFTLLGVLLSGAVSVVMFVLVALCGVLYLLDTRFGVKTYALLGFKGASQNVVARHPAAVAPADGQKAHPVVIVAHYDTPRSDILSKPALAWVKPYLPRVMDVALVVSAVCLLVQLLSFLSGIHAFCAALAVLASVVLIAWAVCTLLHLFVLSYTLGANNNKSGVAAVFGVLDRIRPCPDGMPFGPDDEIRDEDELGADGPDELELDDEGDARAANVSARAQGVSRPARAQAGEARRAVPADSAGDEDRMVMRPRRPLEASAADKAPAAPKATRHGLKTLRMLGILPESCQIEYVAQEGRPAHRASRPDVAGASQVAEQGRTTIFDSRELVAQPAPEPLDPEARKDAEADAMFASIVRENGLSGDPKPAPAAKTSLLTPLDSSVSTITSADEPDTELRAGGAAPRDVAMHSANVSAQFVMDEPNSFTASVIQDPTWGTSSFKPVSAGNTATRFLGDLPDPAVAAVDPYGVSNIQTVGDYNPDDFSSMDFETGTHQSVTPAMLEQARRQDLAGFSTDLSDSPKRGRKAKKSRQKGRISTRAADMQQQMQEQSFNDWLGLDEDYDAKKNGAQIGSWDNFADDAPRQQDGHNRWQGGAAPRRQRHVSAEAEEAVRARRAAMRLGDRDLTAHEVWFVLTGAGEAGNAGIRDFISTYRDQVKGAYFINLECLGAGRQSLVVEERADHSAIKADRRLVNLFGQASADINRPLALARMPWRTSDASVALDCGCRAVTLCGVDRGVPANAQWTGDSPEKLDPLAIEDAVDMVVEVIKNA